MITSQYWRIWGIYGAKGNRMNRVPCSLSIQSKMAANALLYGACSENKGSA